MDYYTFNSSLEFGVYEGGLKFGETVGRTKGEGTEVIISTTHSNAI